MIPFSPRAKRQLDDLTRHYAERGRDAAIDNLVDSVERASARYLANRGLFYDAPRPYPYLASARVALGQGGPVLDRLQPGKGWAGHSRDLLRGGQHAGPARVTRRPGPRRARPDPIWASAGSSFYLTRTDGGRALFLYGWDDRQSAWGPDRTKAYRFASAPLALDMAVRCGGPSEGASPITTAED